MEGLRIVDDGAVLEADFFRDSGVCFCDGISGTHSRKNAYNCLISSQFLKHSRGLGYGKRFLGEINSVHIDDYLNPSLIYHFVEWDGGKKKYGPEKMLPLETVDFDSWSRVFGDDDSRRDLKVSLILPDFFYLEGKSLS